MIIININLEVLLYMLGLLKVGIIIRLLRRKLGNGFSLMISVLRRLSIGGLRRMHLVGRKKILNLNYKNIKMHIYYCTKNRSQTPQKPIHNPNSPSNLNSANWSNPKTEQLISCQ